MMRRELIPGLPDDVPRECLVRVGYGDFPASRSVCGLWRREIGSPSFRRRRKAAGLSRPVLAFAAKRGGGEPTHLALFEPTTGSWSHLPPVPWLPRGLPLFCRLAAVGWELLVVGGWDPSTWAASDAVHIYDFAVGSWRRGAPLPGPRRSFACAVPAGEGPAAVLVAGGRDEEKNALRSAMAYDVARDKWAALPDMAMERDECGGVFMRGRFHVVGGYSTAEQGRLSRTAEALDVEAARWGSGGREAGGWDVPEDLRGGLGRRREDVHVQGRAAGGGGDGGGGLAGGGGSAGGRELQLVGWDEGLMVVGSECDRGEMAGYVMGEGARVEIPKEYSGQFHMACFIQIWFWASVHVLSAVLLEAKKTSSVPRRKKADVFMQIFQTS